MTSRRTEHQMTELARELRQPPRANPMLAVYRWRYEIAVLALVPWGLIELDRELGLVWSLVALVITSGALYYWPAAQRFIWARLRAVVVQHRLRTAFTAARVCSVDGRRPAILWTKPRGKDVHVLLFCPAGVDVDRIDDQRRLLASACFAADAEVRPHPKYAHLAILTIRSS
ncbi:hypothetical protein [Amycolatopsis alkalitolerans]|uniref:Uncharacterized protein n=1 Tax=Amycolatopsis alkalitolerans TaxID=2547244 RepID=A0A5C4LXQ6_9PSEU|nr:hypothetical protein [Amycolatopsis alkalitolerans]TNC22924.1 hypothetical protein FG385_23835 [Amycolatopsis alkalitolerans]